MAPASNEEQFKFLISCIRYSNNGKVDFSQVAKECKIVSKGAAAKRYERMMRAHGIAPNAAAARPTPARALKAERHHEPGPPASTSPPPAPKKRKADPRLEESSAADDDEGFATLKAEPAGPVKEEEAEEEERQRQRQRQQHGPQPPPQPPQPGQLSLDEASSLMQYYDTPSQYAGGVGMGAEDGYHGEYSPVSGRAYGSSMGTLYGMGSPQPYGFSSSSLASYGHAGMGGVPSGGEPQRMSYPPLMQYSSDEPGQGGQGRSDSPVIVD